MTDLKALLQKAHSSRMKHAFSALVDIRQHFMKSKDDVELLIKGKLIQRILGLLKTRDILEDQYKVKVVDISVSILGNLCMEEAARKVVIRENGVGTLVVLFREVESKKIQNRVCRCLANLLLDPGSWKFICCLPVIEKTVKLLEDVEEEEFRLTCIRAIRLMGQSTLNVSKLLEKNVLGAVLKLVDSDTESVHHAAVRCVHSLGVHGCSAQFASQLLASGKLQYLFEQIKQRNYDVFQLITHLMEHHNFRVDFGSTCGIVIFHDLLLSEEDELNSWKIDLLNGLCLCCKEVTNRVKLREAGVLPSFLQSLKQDRFDTLHTRIISALICFLYDEASFAVLLDNRMVPILVKHLEKTFTEFDVKDNTSDMAGANIENEFKEKVESKATSPANPDSDSNSDTVFGQEPEDQSNSSQPDKKPVYSLDSPTYKTGENWEFNNMIGAKCIQSFTPPHMLDQTGRSSYSPLSNSSYYSPGCSSPEFSPPASPCSSPETSGSGLKHGTSTITLGTSQRVYSSYLLSGSQSPENLHPKYPKYTGISCHMYKATEMSDVDLRRKSLENKSSEIPVTKKTAANSRDLSPGACSPLQDVFEETEDPLSPDIADTSLKATCISLNMSSKQKDEVNSSPPGQDPENTRDVDVEEKKTRNVNFCSFEKGGLITEEISEEYKQQLENIKQTLKGDQETCTRKFKSGCSDCNILILLSRVSQMTNPSASLVSREVITCLLNYMTKMEAPLSRCPRLLSRVFRNPLCFERVLNLGVPLLIYQKLLIKQDIPVLVKSLKGDAKIKHGKIIYSKLHVEVDRLDSVDEDRFSTVGKESSEEQPAKRRRLSLSLDDTTETRFSRGKSSEFSLCDVGKSGLAFLEDLSGIADSSYGRGTVDRMLHSTDDAQRLDIAISMLFVTWSQSSRSHYMYQREMLDTVLDALQPSPAFTEEKFVCVVAGIRFLAQVIDTRTKFQESIKTDISWTTLRDHLDCHKYDEITIESELLPGKENSTNIDSPCSSGGCKLQHIPADLFFQIEDLKIPASRNLMSRKSEIFSAMLEGKFSEAHLTVIPMPEACKEAFEVLVHYLHGCRWNMCDTIENIFSEVITDETAANCIELLNECEKYNICDLSQHAYRFLCNNCITPSTSFLIFKYAVLHRDETLMKACVSSLLFDPGTLEETVSLLSQCLSSKYAKVFCQIVSDILLQ